METFFKIRVELLEKFLMPKFTSFTTFNLCENAVKNDLAVDSDNLKALKSFGFGWLIRKDLDRRS